MDGERSIKRLGMVSPKLSALSPEVPRKEPLSGKGGLQIGVDYHSTHESLVTALVAKSGLSEE